MSPNFKFSLPLADYEHYVERCLSMVLHHDEIQLLIKVVREVHEQRETSSAMEAGGHHG